MKFTYTIPLAKEMDEVWEKMQDATAVVRCIPGVEEVESTEENRYQVVIVTKLGPVKLRFKGNAELKEDVENRSMEANVSMSDARSGNVYGTFAMNLQPGEGEAKTTIHMASDVAIAGKLGEFAQPLIKRKADQIVKEFSGNLVAMIG